MDYQLLIIFIVLNAVNVIVQTVKSICTVKSGKVTAALVNAGAYGLYTIIVVYMLCDLPLLWKAGIIALCNLVGVFCVKLIEEKSRKDKLWKVEATISKADFLTNKELIDLIKVPHNYIDINKWVVLNFYCNTKKQSETVKDLLDEMNAKYFVAESKALA